MSTFHKLTIKKIIKETQGAISILFDIPSELKKTYSFIAGQYVTLKTSINGKEVRRAYSICSSPNSNELKVAIKAVENGLFSTFATTKLKDNDSLKVSAPEGKFVLQPKAHKNYIAFAAGSGITPVLSMIKAVLENETASTFTLIYGNKSVENTIFKKELDNLNTLNTNFNVHYVFSKEKVNDCKFGRINKDITSYFFKNKYKQLSFDAAFLCGPEEMIDTVSETLQENNFNKENIFFELFTTSTKEKSIETGQGKSEVTILLDDEESTFIMDKKDDILAASLRNNLDAPYSCQGGVCSSCLGKVTDGKAIMIKNSILTDAEIEEGLILTCQAHPLSSKVVVDFDDV